MTSSLVNLINTTRNVLIDIEVTHKENKQKNTTILEDLKSSVEWAFINMDLDEKQEEFFRELLNHAKEQSISLFEADIMMDEKIEKLLALLSMTD